MLNALEILDKIRQIRALTRAPSTSEVLSAPVAHVGAPAHLAPGQKVTDPVTGQEGEVIAYGRAHTVAPAAPSGGA